MAPRKEAKAPKVEVDYSVLEKGQRIQAESDGTYYAAEVVIVSKSAKKAKAPVKVHFLGYDEEWDLWLGSESIRCKALKATETKAEEKPKKDKAPAKEKKGKGDDKKTSEKTRSARDPLEVEMGYWNTRGLGAIIRMILEYKGVKYTGTQYSSIESWFVEGKPKIMEKNPLANLPYVIAGDVCVCQSNAILGFLGTRLRLGGNNTPDRLKNEQLISEITDVWNDRMNLVYPFKQECRTEDEFKAKAEKTCDDPPFKKFEAWLEFYKTDYFVGSKPCTCDFHIWEQLDHNRLLAEKMGKPNILEKFPLCKAFYDRFRALESLQKYFESDDYKLNVNNPLGATYFTGL